MAARSLDHATFGFFFCNSFSYYQPLMQVCKDTLHPLRHIGVIVKAPNFVYANKLEWYFPLYKIISSMQSYDLCKERLLSCSHNDSFTGKMTETNSETGTRT